MEVFVEILKAIVLGVVEGITEWLPISSTGHMILVDEFLKLNVSAEFMEMFRVVIQLGAILAVVIVFWKNIWPFCKTETKKIGVKMNTLKMWGKILVASIPAGIVGLLFDDFLDEHLYNYITVAVTLIIYGIFFILIENWNKHRTAKIATTNDITFKLAFIIGAFQMLSLIPGTSRSGATIIGALLIGVSRVASAEFTFYMAIPAMAGASLYKIAKFVLNGYSVTSTELLVLAVGSVVAFAVSIFAIKFLMGYIRKHDFKVFGIYRIVLGVIVILYFLITMLISK